MKMSKKLLVIGFIFVGAICAVPLINVFAESPALSDQQITVIQNNCASAKNTLNQLHVSDTLLRVNMGQIYESMSTKLMDKFNSRIAYNRLDNANLVSAAKNYVSALDVFRLDYQSYEEQLASTLSIDCVNQPVAFYDAVLLAHQKRNQVHTDVSNLNQYIDEYKLAVEQFEEDHQSVDEGDKK